MTDSYGMHVQFTAKPGKGDEVQAILLEAAEGTQGVQACRLYVVSRSPENPDTVWVTEAWTSREAHDASLGDAGTQALIQRTVPLLAGQPEATELRPSGGKGL